MKKRIYVSDAIHSYRMLSIVMVLVTMAFIMLAIRGRNCITRTDDVRVYYVALFCTILGAAISVYDIGVLIYMRIKPIFDTMKDFGKREGGPITCQDALKNYGEKEIGKTYQGLFCVQISRKSKIIVKSFYGIYAAMALTGLIFYIHSGNYSLPLMMILFVSVSRAFAEYTMKVTNTEEPDDGEAYENGND